VFFLAFALRKQGIIGALWCYPAVISFYFMLPERKAWIANAVLLAVALPQAWGALEAPLAARVAATLLAVSAFSAIFVRVIIDQQRRLEAQAITDPLTGLSNRTTLRAALEQAIQQSSRTRTPMTLVALDLDRFKSINDSLGHDAGDSVLRAVGDLLHRRIRRADKVFRLGGEEFLALLYGTNEENGRRVAEELRGAVASLALLPDRPVTVSIGVATLRPDESWIEWMKRSDENLYRAKASGRDRVAA
jgi:diguanylate cyclase (GGDEF)-like protein